MSSAQADSNLPTDSSLRLTPQATIMPSRLGGTGFLQRHLSDNHVETIGEGMRFVGQTSSSADEQNARNPKRLTPQKPVK